jgi:xylan 1,4-beta-xylosidase
MVGRHPTVDAWAVRRGQDLTIVLTNHTFPTRPIACELVRLEIAGRPRGRAFVRRIDDRHANAPAAWRAMGSPEYPSREQVEGLIEASRLTEDPMRIEVVNSAVLFDVELSPHAVAVATLEGICP